MALDFIELRLELVRAVRGDLSQGQLNKRLKYKSNQIYRWESGQSSITWREFCLLCEASKRPIRPALEKVIFFYNDPINSKELIARLVIGQKQADVAKCVGVSRSVVSRWVKGGSEPLLEHVLRLIDWAGLSLTQFIGSFVDTKKIPSIHEELRLEELERNLHFKYPFVGALLLCLRTPSYLALPAHDDRFVSMAVGVPEEELRAALNELAETRSIEMHIRHYRPRRVTISLSGDREGAMRLRDYWQHRCRKLLTKVGDGTPLLWPQLVFNCDPATYKEIFDKVVALYEDIVRMSANDKIEADEIYLFSLQLLDIRKLPPDES